MPLKKLLLFHAIITMAAGIVLIAAPQWIPQAVNIELPQSAALLSYLLGAAEIGFAFLSFSSRAISDRKALRIVSKSLIVFHSATALVEGFVVLNGGSMKLALNMMVRVLVVLLFYYYGVRGKGDKAAANV